MAEDRIQIPIRLPRDLVAQIDARRKLIDEPSRNAWVERVIRWALDNEPTRRVVPPKREPRVKLT
jgi:metal-responsive CopG/Arc/MetJ family transcriptional regulator